MAKTECKVILYPCDKKWQSCGESVTLMLCDSYDDLLTTYGAYHDRLRLNFERLYGPTAQSVTYCLSYAYVDNGVAHCYPYVFPTSVDRETLIDVLSSDKEVYDYGKERTT